MENFPQVQKQVFSLLLGVPLLLVSITCLGQWLSKAGYRRKFYKRRRDSASLLESVIAPSATSKYEMMELYEGTASLRKWGSPQHVDTHAGYFPASGIGKVDFSQASLPIHERHTANQSVTLMLILTTTWPVFHQWKDHTALTQTSLDATIQFGMNANQTWH
ncbi:hypothetical protein EDD17DRAFT_1510661 [Pisolithus thermaeus]|nr:hypothetical protein EDD17DRAFT_1510661 [Pisolithus thermaeus]